LFSLQYNKTLLLFFFLLGNIFFHRVSVGNNDAAARRLAATLQIEKKDQGKFF